MKAARALLLRKRPFSAHHLSTAVPPHTSSDTSQPPPPPPRPPHWEDLRRMSREDRERIQSLIRASQAAEALLAGLAGDRRVCRGSTSEDVEHFLRSTRARPSLLTPIAGGIGLLLGAIPPLRPLASQVVSGVVQEAMDDNIRAVLQASGRDENTPDAEKQSRATEPLKEYFKRRRDSLPEAGPGILGLAASGALSANPAEQFQQAVIQATSMACRSIVNAARRV